MYSFYHEPLFRPPSEAASVIIQPTIGCSWNRCAFCEMYKGKKFRVLSLTEIEQQVKELATFNSDARKLFLADGNALAIPFDELCSILDIINTHFPKLRRISTYASANDIACKTKDELLILKSKGIKILYVGIESGNDELLAAVNKRSKSAETIEALNMAQDIGMDLSVMILSALGGKNYTREHAIDSAKVVNQIQPKYLSVLTLNLPYGVEKYQQHFKGEYIPMDEREIIKELRLFIETTDLKGSIFRNNHVSNFLILDGTLPKNKERMLATIDDVVNSK